MGQFVPLYVAIQPHLEKAFDQIPRNIGGAVSKVMTPLEWKRSSAEQRARRLFFHDVRADPATDRSCLDAYDVFLEEAHKLERKLIGAARKRWGLTAERKIDPPDQEQINRAFRVWFWKWWREHKRQAPTRKQVYELFGHPRGIGEKRSYALLKLVRKDVQQKRGQPGLSKRGRPKSQKAAKAKGSDWTTEFLR